MKKVLLFLFFFLMSGCGYQPIYLNKNIQNLEFSKIILDGNQDLNKVIIEKLSIRENNENERTDKLYLKSLYKNETTSKNTKGQSVSFKSTIEVNLQIENINSEIVSKRNFTKEFTYNHKNNQFGLAEYEASIKKNLIDTIINEIIIYLNTV
jgi:outer membrane lipopolysaccharide assembly protein LptE/RlpB